MCYFSSLPNFISLKICIINPQQKELLALLIYTLNPDPVDPKQTKIMRQLSGRN